MKNKVFVFDPTLSDKLSSVRGVGRYLQILKENLPKNTIFTDSPKMITADSVFINPFFNFLQPPLTLKRLAKKQIAVIHDLIPFKYPSHFPVGIKGKINIFLNKLVLKNYDLIITDSQASKKDIVQILKINEKKVRVIYPCLPKIFTRYSIFDIRYSEKTQKNPISNIQYPISKFCLYVGDATWNKNLVNLAKAIKIINVSCVLVGKIFERYSIFDIRYWQIKTKNPNIQYQISNINQLSHPWQKEFRDFLKEVKDDKRFIFFGFVDDYRLIKLYQQALVNILPSRAEGFGFSFLEAASQGCPSVLGDIAVLREIAQDSAYYANPDDPYDLANKIGEIYFNHNLRNKIGNKALERFRYFSGDKFKKSFLSLIKDGEFN
ncbi:MAG: glycosyltransferase family 4 protein [Microgenomates group bacterium]